MTEIVTLKKKHDKLYAFYKRCTFNTDKWKRREKICHANANHKKARAAVIILDKIESRTKSITGDRKGHSITVKEPFHQEDKIICVGTHKLEPLST